MLQKKEFMQAVQQAIDLALFDHRPFDDKKAIAALKHFYAEFELSPPVRFYVYDNITAVIEQFADWSVGISGAPTAWDWNFPMTNPGAFWLYIVVKDRFHLGFQRKGPGLFTIQATAHNAGEQEVPKVLLEQMWTELAMLPGIETYQRLLEADSSLLLEDETVYTFLQHLLDDDSPESPDEVFFLGSDFKLVYEVAACNYLAQHHDIKRNTGYLQCLHDMLAHCGTVLAFNEVAVLCKKVNYRLLPHLFPPNE